MKGYLLMTHMYWPALLCVVELLLSGHRGLGLIGRTCRGKTRAEGRLMEDTWCLEGITRTPCSDGDRAWLVGTAGCAVLVGCGFSERHS